MRVRSLKLDKYGAFEDRGLAFGPGLTLVVGRNEAGKSTMLDALADLLWGFGRGNPRSFNYGPAALSLSARVELPDGTEADLRRHKAGLVVEATREPFRPFWGMEGTESRNRWRQAFGLSHDALRAGGAAVFAGTGDLAELIFTARSGQAVRAHVEALAKEMEQLYKAHGGAKKVHVRVALADYDGLERQVKATMARAGDVAAAADELERATREVKAFDARLARASGHLHRLTEHERAVPIVRELLRLREARASLLAGGVALDPEQLAAYEAATAEIEAADAEIERLRGERDGAGRERAGLTIDDALLADGETITKLARAAQARHADRRRAADGTAQSQRLLAQVRAELASLVGPGDERDAASLMGALHVPADLASQLDELAAALAGLRAELTRAEQDCDQARGRQDVTAGAVPSFDAAALDHVREVLAAFDAEGSAAARTRTALAESAQAAARRREALRRAGVPETDGDGDGDCAPPEAPAADLVRRLRTGCREAGAALDRRAAELATAATAEQRAQDKLDATGGADLPDQQTLAQARAERGRLWDCLVAAWAGGGGAVADAHLLAMRVAEAMRTADEVADRLIRDADLAASQAQSRAELDRAQTGKADAAQRHAAALAAAAAARQEWEQLWAGLGFSVGVEAGVGVGVPSLDGADDVRAALDDAQQAHTQWLAAHELLSGLAGQLDAQRTALAAALAAAGRPRPDADLDSLVVAARDLLGDDDEAREARTIAAQAAREVAEAERARDSRRRDLDAAQERWRELLAAAALAPATTPTGWASRREILDRARAAYTEADDLRTDAAVAMAAYEEFAAGVAACAARHAVAEGEGIGVLDGLEHGAENETLDALVRRLDASRAARATASSLDRRLDELTTRIEAASARRAKAAAQVDGVCGEAGLAGAHALPDAAERGREAQHLAALADQAQDRIRAAVPHSELEELVGELADLDDATLAGDLDAARAEVAEVEGLREAAQTAVGTNKARLDALAGADSVGDLHARAQEKLALVAEYAERYIIVRLQYDVLRQQLEAYEQRHVSPMLVDAGRLLEKLTEGRFVALRAADGGDGRRTLAVVRADEMVLAPGELSEGTADQVYLALRLAGIDQLQRERCAAGQSPLPVVLDDVLMTFDDRRAQAALQVMAELAGSWQVVVLTHHEHLAELAGAARLPAVQVSRLPDPDGLEVERDAEQIRTAGAVPIQRRLLAHPVSGRAAAPELASVSAARRNGSRGPGAGAAGGSTAGADYDPTAVRTWARANGFEVGDRGRISAEILDAYRRAQPA